MINIYIEDSSLLKLNKNWINFKLTKKYNSYLLNKNSSGKVMKTIYEPTVWWMFKILRRIQEFIKNG